MTSISHHYPRLLLTIAFSLVTTGCSSPTYYVLGGGYSESKAALKYIGHSIEPRQGTTPSSDEVVSVPAPEDDYILGITGHREELDNLKAEVQARIINATVLKCAGQIGANLNSSTTKFQSIDFEQELQPSSSNWVWIGNSCCNSDGTTNNRCGSKNTAVVVSFYKTKAVFKSTYTTSLVPGVEIKCTDTAVEPLPNVSATVAADGHLKFESTGWNVVKTQPLDEVCRKHPGASNYCPQNYEKFSDGCRPCAHGLCSNGGLSVCGPCR